MNHFFNKPKSFSFGLVAENRVKIIKRFSCPEVNSKLFDALPNSPTP